jgi:hypothetical protein
MDQAFYPGQRLKCSTYSLNIHHDTLIRFFMEFWPFSLIVHCGTGLVKIDNLHNPQSGLMSFTGAETGNHNGR